MDHDPLKKEDHLRAKLAEYHVDVPDFDRKPDRWSRFIRFLASPAKDPFDSLVSTSSGMITLKVAPVIGAAGLVVLQVVFFI
ncbi:hypothetical protein [Jeotgalibacillus proteolyticus]|uniref:Uncharacterized protein n=1 Tax=Jeotgalibacillus proteolyticus TaxID=2082395 RepID=A0A2S5G8P7_9BACL|nr:hypothetical protein [Jeotgalibacillus proteolyticus]PPA69303.1 hypothetical protein C4B60_16005 [Jeotgalibacillus proteolyticus]